MAAREKETAVTWAVNKIRHWHQEEGKTQEEIVPLLSEALVTKYHPDKSEEWMEEVFNEAAIVYAAIYRDEERAAARNDIKENLPPMDGSGRRRRGVTISRPDFVAEHVHLLDVLRHGSRAQQEAEASSQQRDS